MQPVTWRLEVDASHLHGVLGVVRGDLSVVQEAFRPWLRILPFALKKKTQQSQKPLSMGPIQPRDRLQPPGRAQTWGWGAALKGGCVQCSRLSSGGSLG